MRHLIIGYGVIGQTTARMLRLCGQSVFAYDIDMDKVSIEMRGSIDGDYDMHWICTAEWDVERAFDMITPNNLKMLVIRSTTSPGVTASFEGFVNYVAHVPEFIRAKYALEDAESPDRIIIGTNNNAMGLILKSMFIIGYPDTPIYITTPNESEMIKLVSNAYLSTQISFWNEIREICRMSGIEPKMVIDGVAADHRVSEYGQKDKGPFKGFCLPKDLNSLIMFSAISMGGRTSKLLLAVKEINDDKQ